MKHTFLRSLLSLSRSKFPLRSLLFEDVTQRSLPVSYRCFGATCWPHIQWARGPIIRRNAGKSSQQSALRNISEERRSHLVRSGNLKSLKTSLFFCFAIQRLIRLITMSMRACLFLLSRISRSLLHMFVSYAFNMLHFVLIVPSYVPISPSFPISIRPCQLKLFKHFWARFCYWLLPPSSSLARWR